MRLILLLLAMCITAGTAPAAFAQADCALLTTLRENAANKTAAIKAAAATKKQLIVCAAFRDLAAAEAKLVQYVEEHGTGCATPLEDIKMTKAKHARTLDIGARVCDVAPPPPRQTNSDELRCTPQLKGTWVCGGR